MLETNKYFEDSHRLGAAGDFKTIFHITSFWIDFRIFQFIFQTLHVQSVSHTFWSVHIVLFRPQNSDSGHEVALKW